MKRVNRNTRTAQHKYQQDRAECFSKALKIKATPSEKLLYNALKKEGVKFKFQKYFYTKEFCFIVDFFITYYGKNLVIEIDGGYHLTDKQKRYDKQRENWLKDNRKCEVMRFTNDDVLNDVNRIVQILKQKRMSFAPVL